MGNYLLEVEYETAELVSNWKKIIRSVIENELRPIPAEIKIERHLPGKIHLTFHSSQPERAWSSETLQELSSTISLALHRARIDASPTAPHIQISHSTLTETQIGVGSVVNQQLNVNADAAALLDKLRMIIQQSTLSDADKEVAITAVDKMTGSKNPAQWSTWLDILLKVGDLASKIPADLITQLQGNAQAIL